MCWIAGYPENLTHRIFGIWPDNLCVTIQPDTGVKIQILMVFVHAIILLEWQAMKLLHKIM